MKRVVDINDNDAFRASREIMMFDICERDHTDIGHLQRAAWVIRGIRHQRSHGSS
jgi:hypothetical protein